MEIKLTKKMFRDELNQWDKVRRESGKPEHRHNQFHQLKRLYGDYLYYQDRDKFDVNFEEWKKEKLKK